MRVSWLRRAPATIDVSELADIEGVLETALIEARHAITTLRSEPEGTSTIEAIQAYAEEFSQVAGLAVQVALDNDVPEVGAKTRVELLRVIQEALNNIRKHARAARVLLDIHPLDGGVRVVIEDDGTGFGVDQTFEGHFGLQIMRERAESVGGSLQVRSETQAGTQVAVWVPALEKEQATHVDSWSEPA
jgi:signal transduction histidine kinase